MNFQMFKLVLEKAEVIRIEMFFFKIFVSIVIYHRMLHTVPHGIQ